MKATKGYGDVARRIATQNTTQLGILLFWADKESNKDAWDRKKWTPLARTVLGSAGRCSSLCLLDPEEAGVVLSRTGGGPTSARDCSAKPE